MNTKTKYTDEEIETMWFCMECDTKFQEEIVPYVSLEEMESYFDLGYLEEVPDYQECA